MVGGLPAFNTVDYLLLLIMALCALNGLRQGFMVLASRIISVIFGLGLAFYYYDDLTAYAEQNLGLVSGLDQFLRNQIPFAAWGNPYDFLSPTPGFSVGELLQNLAYGVVSVGCFMLLWLGGSQLLKILFACLRGRPSVSLVAGINHLLGMLLSLLQFAVVACLLFGLILPLIQTAAQAGFHWASLWMFHLNNSVLVGGFLQLYHWGHSALGFEV